MKVRSFPGRAALALGLLIFEGCVNTPEGWQILSPMRPPPTTVERWHPPENDSVKTQSKTRYAKRHVSPRRKENSASLSRNSSRREASSSETVPAPVEASPAPTVTLADANISRERVLAMLNQASAKLSMVNRAKLDGNNTLTYDQAAGFLKQARKAAEEKDYVAASGLAQKASILADKLASNHY